MADNMRPVAYYDFKMTVCDTISGLSNVRYDASPTSEY